MNKPRYSMQVLRAMIRYRKSKPWSGSQTERVLKLAALHAELCKYHEPMHLLVLSPKPGEPKKRRSDIIFFNGRHTIVLNWKITVIGYLQEFGWYQGYDSNWGVELFMLVFRRSSKKGMDGTSAFSC